MKQYLTIKNIVLALISVGLLITLSIILKPCNKPSPVDLTRQIDQKAKEEAERVARDSAIIRTIREQLERNEREREQKIIIVTQQANEKIERINRPDFTADSIRRAFADN